MLLTLDAEKFRNRNYAWLIYCVTFIFLLKNHVEKLGFFHNIRWAGWGVMNHDSWLMTLNAWLWCQIRNTNLYLKHEEKTFESFGAHVLSAWTLVEIIISLSRLALFFYNSSPNSCYASLSHLPYIDCCCHCSLVASETLTKITWTMA